MRKPNDSIKNDDFCEMIACQLPRVKSSTVDQWIKALVTVILRQLQLNHKITIKRFGTFELKIREADERYIYNPNTQEKELTYIPQKYMVVFRPSDAFDYAMNENDFKLMQSRRVDSLKRKKNKQKRSKITHIDTTVDLINRANKRYSK